MQEFLDALEPGMKIVKNVLKFQKMFDSSLREPFTLYLWR